MDGILVYALVPRGKVEFNKVSAYAKEMLEKKLGAGFITINKDELCRTGRLTAAATLYD